MSTNQTTCVELSVEHFVATGVRHMTLPVELPPFYISLVDRHVFRT